ncbi:MAG TPA: hypothetical protein VGM72_07220, partial [Micropepsaceae bacterium]
MSRDPAHILLSTNNSEVPQLPKRKTGRFITEFIAVFFWIYALTKLFIFDLDIWIINLVSPQFASILNYKLPIILVGISIAIVTTRSARLGLSALYIAFYPLVILSWKIPRFVWHQKSWLLAF